MTRPRSLPLNVVVALGLAFAGCEKKSDPSASARVFFERVAAGQAQVAYDSSAFGFQAQRNAIAFEAAAREMGLAGYKGGEWGKPEIEGRSAKIPVHFKTPEGKDVSLNVTLTKESGEWKVFSLKPASAASENRFSLVGTTPTWTDDRGQVRNAGLKKLEAAQPVPPEEDQRRLVRETLVRFNDAIVTESFDAFYESVSLAWQTGSLTQEQNKLTKGQLQRAFQAFVEKKVRLTGIEKLDPIWDAASTVGTDGMLSLTGHFPTEPYQTHFALKFNYEVPEWKLFAIDVNLRK